MITLARLSAMDQQQRTSRRTVVIAVTAAVAAVVLAGVIALVLADGDGSPARAGASPGASTYDKATIKACKYAQQAANATSVEQAAADTALQAARSSDVAALREVRTRYKWRQDAPLGVKKGLAMAAAYYIATWCVQHHLD